MTWKIYPYKQKKNFTNQSKFLNNQGTYTKKILTYSDIIFFFNFFFGITKMHLFFSLWVCSFRQISEMAGPIFELSSSLSLADVTEVTESVIRPSFYFRKNYMFS